MSNGRSLAQVPNALLLAAASAVIAWPGTAAAQSVNIDFGGSGSAPSASYGAAGPAGTWNAVGLLGSGVLAPLVGLDGAPTAAKVRMIGADALVGSNDPATSGDDQALIDDMLIGFNDPLDVCVWVEDLEPGDYEVLIYALTPNNPTLMHRVRVDFATPGATWIGGAWPGAHQEGVTFERFNVTVTDGTIGLHSGLIDASIESGINGLQVVSAATSVGSAPSAAPGTLAIRSISPNPASGPQRIELSVPRALAPGAILAIHDVAGRLVWSRSLAGLGEGTQSVLWDGRDVEGREVPAAVYLVRTGGDRAAARKILRVR
jgi:hypothetical protein